MKRILIVLSLLISPGVVCSEPAPVLTGEHGTFTRVVVSLPSDGIWQLGRNSNGYTLRIPSNDGYALEQFFDLIPRSRIAAVSQSMEKGELYIAASCICHVSAQVFNSNYLVLDVRDGPAPSDSAFERMLPDLEGPPASRAISTAEARPTLTASDRLLPLILPNSQSIGVDETGKTDLSSPKAPYDVPPADLALEAETLDQIVQSLSEGMGRGLTEGVLQRAQAPDLMETGDDTAEITAAFPGVRAQTSIDTGTRLYSNARDETQTGVECLPAAYFDVASWGRDTRLMDQLGAARRNVVDAADQINSQAVLALAQLYVFLGFGQEALQALQIDGIQSRKRVLLGAIARIVEGEAIDSGPFQGQVSCPSNVALWALLADNSPPTDALVNRVAVVNAYDALPKSVQMALAARLAEKLISAGAEDEALQILGSEFAPDLQDVEMTLAKAALADALGDDDSARMVVADVARTAPRGTATAMAQYFLSGIASGAVFSDGDFTLADAIRFENGSNPDAMALAHAQIRAYASMDRFEDARTLLRQASEDAQPDYGQTMVDNIYQQATLRLSDGEFVEFVWNKNPSDIGPNAREAIAKRLNALGFIDRSAKFASGDLDPLTEPPSPTSAVRDGALSLILDLNEQNQEAEQQITGPPSKLAGVFPTQETGATLRESRKLVEESARARSEVGALLNELTILPTP